jgi:hypothetical protein
MRMHARMDRAFELTTKVKLASRALLALGSENLGRARGVDLLLGCLRNYVIKPGPLLSRTYETKISLSLVGMYSVCA